jgi:hypothetical protein
MAEYAQKLEANGLPFSIKSFLDNLNKMGNIPMDLSRQEILDTVGKE